jgi:hypothetical protein
VGLTLIESRTQATNFSFQRRDMANRTHGNATEFIRATASFRQLTRILIGSTLLRTLGSGLFASSMRVGERGDDAGREKAKFQASTPCRISGVENRHAHERDTSC